MKLRPFIAALLTFWLVIGPAGTAWAAYATTPCESMSGMGQPLPPADDCCGGGAMDASACLGACMATGPAAVAAALLVLHAAASAIPGLSLQYATVLSPPDIAPPKALVS
jgi:hypothetical protein